MRPPRSAADSQEGCGPLSLQALNVMHAGHIRPQPAQDCSDVWCNRGCWIRRSCHLLETAGGLATREHRPQLYCRAAAMRQGTSALQRAGGYYACHRHDLCVMFQFDREGPGPCSQACRAPACHFRLNRPRSPMTPAWSPRCVMHLPTMEALHNLTSCAFCWSPAAGCWTPAEHLAPHMSCPAG